MRFKVAIKILWLDSAESSIVAFKKVESSLYILRFLRGILPFVELCKSMELRGIATITVIAKHFEKMLWQSMESIL